MRLIRQIIRIILWILVGVIAFALLSNLWVVHSTQDRVHQSLDKLSSKNVGLVLGTSKRLRGGEPNPYFHNRMKAAAEVYHDSIVSHIIVSGDNNTKYYNEPLDMKKALVDLGVPSSDITLDYAGFRTLDSIIRCKEIFGQDKIVVITQRFHSYRALFICDFYDLNAEVYAAQNHPDTRSNNVWIREFLARPKAVLDLYLLGETPKFLGEKQKLDLR